jgi:hypothetical protein
MIVREGETIVFTRKFRWMFQWQSSAMFVNVPTRPGTTPKLSDDKIYTKNHWSGSDLISGSGKFAMVFYDHEETGKCFFDYLKEVYERWAPNYETSLKDIEEIKIDFDLILYDGCGNELEKWKLCKAYPTSIQWDALDYSASEPLTYEIIWEYESAEHEEMNWSRTTNPFDFSQGVK